jgi:hypothetical protein
MFVGIPGRQGRIERSRVFGIEKFVSTPLGRLLEVIAPGTEIVGFRSTGDGRPLGNRFAIPPVVPLIFLGCRGDRRAEAIFLGCGRDQRSQAGFRPIKGVTPAVKRP